MFLTPPYPKKINKITLYIHNSTNNHLPLFFNEAVIFFTFIYVILTGTIGS